MTETVTAARKLDVVVFEAPGLGDRSYLLHDGAKALVVDPQRDPHPYLKTAEDLGLDLTLVLETHVHNDYVSGGLALARRAGATYGVPAGVPFQFSSEAAALEEGDVLPRRRPHCQGAVDPGPYASSPRLPGHGCQWDQRRFDRRIASAGGRGEDGPLRTGPGRKPRRSSVALRTASSRRARPRYFGSAYARVRELLQRGHSRRGEREPHDRVRAPRQPGRSARPGRLRRRPSRQSVTHTRVLRAYGPDQPRRSHRAYVRTGPRPQSDGVDGATELRYGGS